MAISTPTNTGTYTYGTPDLPVVFSTGFGYGPTPFSKIARVVYKRNGVTFATHDFLAVLPSGDDPQGAPLMTSEPIGSLVTTSTIYAQPFFSDGVGGYVPQGAGNTITINWVQGSFVNPPATAVTPTTATVHGSYVIYAGNHGRFRYGTTSGGPYTNTIPAIFDGGGVVHADLTGLIPGTTYYYIFETQYPDNSLLGPSAESNFTSVAIGSACEGASGITQTTATLNGNVNPVPAGGSARFRRGTVSGGPYSTIVPATQFANGEVIAQNSGLTAGTQYFYILEIFDSTNTLIGTSGECSFTTKAATVPLPPGSACPPPAGVKNCPPISVYSVGGTEYVAFQLCDLNGPILAVYQLCSGVPAGAPTYYNVTTGAVQTPVGAVKACGAGFDFDQLVFCDAGNNNTPFISRVLFTESGDLIPDGSGTFALDATTPYTPVGPVQVCDSITMSPQPFCFKDSVTAPQTFPGRKFTGLLPLAIGYTVNSVIISGVTYPLAITWSILDENATDFTATLAAAIQGKMSGSTVTISPTVPIDSCVVTPQNFTINVDCIKATKAPNDITFVYDGGSDLILNAGFDSNPNDFSFHQGKRQDNGGFIRCTNIANRGWETNDPLRQFEQWPAGFLGSTPTPRGTAIQEVNANGANTIWQTVVVPVGGNFTIKATVGGRGVTEQFPIRLSTGDTNATGPGDIINAVITAPSITGGLGTPWTNFTQSLFLAAGIYTLSLKGPNTPSIGGIFTDLRMFTTVPNQTKSLTPDDTCTVTENVTTDTNTCELWQPITGPGGLITNWRNPETGVVMTNAAFWSQVPAPTCCTASSGSGDTSVTAPNLLEWYPVCGTVGGVQIPLIRQLITDQNGGVISEQFIGADGVPAAPTSWTSGTCEGSETKVLCDDNGTFLRRYFRNSSGQIATLDFTLDGSTVYIVSGLVKTCGGCEHTVSYEQKCQYDTITGAPVGSPLYVTTVLDCTGNRVSQTITDSAGAIAVPIGFLATCGAALDYEQKILCFEILCDSTNATFLRRYNVTNAGVVTKIDTALDGVTVFVPTGAVDLCKCSSVNPLISSTINQIVGATSFAVPSGARSITLVVTAGSMTVTIGAAPAITVIAGVTLTWSVDMGGSAGEALASAHTFLGTSATANAYITTTREI